MGKSGRKSREPTREPTIGELLDRLDESAESLFEKLEKDFEELYNRLNKSFEDVYENFSRMMETKRRYRRALPV
jgi:chromosome segregation ATPase